MAPNALDRGPPIRRTIPALHPLFASNAKFNSGSGWPSFSAPLDNAVETETDRSFFTTRTEVHCSRCGGHLGHVFDDGPEPTGQRYCMNGVSLDFHPAATPPATGGSDSEKSAAEPWPGPSLPELCGACSTLPAVAQTCGNAVDRQVNPGDNMFV